jgi:hypothetical protein
MQCPAPSAAPVWRVVRSAQRSAPRRFVHAAINKPKHDPNFACMWMPDGCQIVTGAPADTGRGSGTWAAATGAPGRPCSIKHSLGGLTSRRQQRRVHHMGWRRLPISYHLAGFPDFLPIPPLPYCAHRRTPAPTLSCAVAFFAVPVVRRRMNLRCAQWHGTTRSGHTSYQQT